MKSTVKVLGRLAQLQLLLALVLACAAVVEPQGKNEKKIAAKGEEARKASDVFTEIMNVPDKGIPQGLLDKAEAVAVFPGVVKGGFIVGARGGHGVVSRRVPGGWSAPAFFNLGGGSVGLQIGAAKTDFVLLFMNQKALGSLLKNKFEVGGEGSVAAGPVGRSTSATTDAAMNAEILSYSRSKGVFAGLELKGTVIDPDNDDNVAVYGKKADQILAPGPSMPMAQIPAGVRIFPQTLARYSARR